uniref:B30.2/SPRY domain-containing protein n=1 Tax=Meloidogyne incognita TaxID=6306 RepID=A0A914LV21_MELIC
MSSKLLKNADNSTTSNSSNDSSASHSQQKKRKRTLELEMEMEQTNLEMKSVQGKVDLANLEMKSVQDKVDLENFKMKLIKDKVDLQNLLKEEINKNEKLAAEKEEYKRKSELYWEEWAQLGRDHIKIGNELNKLKEDYQNSSKTMLNEKNELAKKLEKINKENIKLREEKNLNLKELENYRNACQLPTDEKTALLKQNNQLSLELQRANSELTKCKNELALNLKLVRYVPITNKITEISNYLTCCGNKCINLNLSEGTCNGKQGFIRAQDNGIVKYYSAEIKDLAIGFYAENSFTKAAGFCCHYSLFYFEITMLEQLKNICYAGIGFNKDDNTPVMIMSNGPITYSKLYQKSSWKDGDVFGCGVVFPAKKESKTLPYVFFTKNGRRIGNKFSLKEDSDNLRPYFKLLSCSIEINFGNDLENEPFSYNTFKHNI